MEKKDFSKVNYPRLTVEQSVGACEQSQVHN